MDDLLVWLNAALDEIERKATRARDHEPHSDGEWAEQSDSVYDIGNGMTITPDLGHGTWAKHIDQNDPRSVLARVEAERAVATHCSSVLDSGRVHHPGQHHDYALARDALRWLAYGHRYDHPGFDPSWTPEGVEAGKP